MKKYVKFRKWSLGRFTRSVKKMALRQGVNLRLAGLRAAYKDKFTVRYTVAFLTR
jgi:hypothetical protein